MRLDIAAHRGLSQRVCPNISLSSALIGSPLRVLIFPNHERGDAAPGTARGRGMDTQAERGIAAHRSARSDRRTNLAPVARDDSRYRVERQIGYLLRRAHQRASAIFQEQIGDPNITPTQFSSLVKLHEDGEVSQNRLGRLVGMDKATTQGVIRRLKVRNLVSSRADPGDARRTLLRLTGDGELLVQRLMAAGPRVTTETLKPLSPDEQSQLVDLLARIA